MGGAERPHSVAINMPKDQAPKAVSFRGLLISLGVVSGGLAALATFSGLLGRLHWSLDLTSHFRVQYVVVQIIACLGLFALRRPRLGLVLGAPGVLNAVLVAPYFLAASTGSTGPTVTVALFNVSIDNTQYQRVRQLILADEPDVVVLQEVNALWLERLEALGGHYPHMIAEPRDNPFGIAILSRLPLLDSGVVTLGPAAEPSLWVRLAVGVQTVTFLAVHPYPPIRRRGTELRNAQLAAISDFVSRLRGHVVLVGDLNTTSWSPYFADLLSTAGLKDGARGHGLNATWPVSPFFLRIALDHVLVSPGLVVTKYDVGLDSGSDHLPVFATISVLE